MNIGNFLTQAARRFPTRPAVLSGTTTLADFATLQARAQALAGALRQTATPGDRVLIASRNCPEYVELLFAIWTAGLVAVPVNAKLHPREIHAIIADAGPACIFAAAELAPALAVAGARCIEIGSAAYLALRAGPPLPPVERRPDDLAWLFYTSGTTGRSKGAMLTHRNLTAMSVAHLADFDSVTEACSLVHGAPMSHGSGLYIPAYVLRGARQVVPASGGFDTAEFFDLMDVVPGASAFLAPTMLNRLCAEAQARGRPPRALRTIVYGGGPAYLTDLKRALKVLGPVLVQLYGQGEAPMTISGLQKRDHVDADDALLASAGWPRSGVEVRIAGPDDAPLAAGETGEILCRGDVVMAGYWQQPEATAAALRNGWLHTGDVGSLGADGRLTLRDRSKDVIISGGSNIYPREVEDVLLRCPGVAEVSVVGAADPDWGEIVVAFVVPAPGHPLDPAALDRFCIDQIARFKRPKRYVEVAALPKSSYGKVLKRELKARHQLG